MPMPSRPQRRYISWMTFSRRSPLGKSRSMSGHAFRPPLAPERFSFKNRSNNNREAMGSTAVIPRQ